MTSTKLGHMQNSNGEISDLKDWGVRPKPYTKLVSEKMKKITNRQKTIEMKTKTFESGLRHNQHFGNNYSWAFFF